LHASGFHALATKEMANENLESRNVSRLYLPIVVRTQEIQNNDWLKNVLSRARTTARGQTTDQGTEL
jgi:hypothetical protein